MVEVLFSKDKLVVEGVLVLWYNVLVWKEICVEVVRVIDLGEVLKFGCFEQKFGGCCKEVLFVDVFEVVIVVVYLDVGFEFVCEVVLWFWGLWIDQVEDDVWDVKILLQEWVQVCGQKLFVYIEVGCDGFDY